MVGSHVITMPHCFGQVKYKIRNIPEICCNSKIIRHNHRMTRKEQHQRRERIRAAIKAGKNPLHVAIKEHVSVDTVRKATR